MTYETATPAACAALEALADPTRRAIVAALRQGPRPVCELARGLPVSRPAVSQHLRVLSEAGLVEAHPSGRQRLYGLRPEGVAELRSWLDTLWDDALAAFGRAARAQAAAQFETDPRHRGGPDDD